MNMMNMWKPDCPDDVEATILLNAAEQLMMTDEYTALAYHYDPCNRALRLLREHFRPEDLDYTGDAGIAYFNLTYIAGAIVLAASRAIDASSY